MGEWVGKIKDNKVPVIAAFIHWFLLMVIQVDRNFFIYHAENKTMIATKLLSFFLLEAIWVSAFQLYKGWKRGDVFSRRFIHIWSLYSLFICLALVIVWPGTWSWDDLGVLSAAQYYNLVPWQHVLSSYEQIILLQLFPSPGGYVLVKNLLIAAIVAYVIYKVETTFHMRPVFHHHYWLDILVKLLPFMLPPVLMYQFSGYRLGLYIYLELLMLVILVCSVKEGFHWNKTKAAAVAVLISICACWRSESLLYAVLGVLFFLLFRNRSLTRNIRIVGIVMVVVTFGFLTVWQGHALKNNNYELISTLRPGVELIRHADPNKDGVELSLINQVVDVSIIRAHPDHNGEKVYWDDHVIHKGYTKEAYHDYLRSLAVLTVRYPYVFWNERLNGFIATSGFKGKGGYQNVDNSVNMLIPGQWSNKPFKTIVTTNKYPIFQKLRSKVLHFMAMEYKLKPIQPLYAIEWNIIVPMLILIAGAVALLKKRKWQAAVLMAFVLVKIPIVFLTAPSTWFMYYLSFYFLGYVLLDFYLVYRIGEKRNISANER